MTSCEVLLETLAPEAWEAHVAECPACQADLESFAALEGLGALVAEEPLPEGFTERLFARLDSGGSVVVREIPTRRAPVRFGRAFLSAAACLLLVLGGLLLLTPPPPVQVAVTAPPRLVVGLSGATPPAVAASPSAEAVVVERSAALAPGSTLVTASGDGASSVLTTGGDANQVRVGPDTEIRVGRVDDTGAELQLSRGRVWVTEESVRMIVQTPHVTVIPLGTEYEAILDGDGTQVVVYEGSVKVVGADGSSKVLKADQEIAVGPSAPLAQAAPRQVRPERLREDWNRWNRQVRLRGQPSAQRRAQQRERGAEVARDQRPPQWLQERWKQPGVQHPAQRGADLERWQAGSREEREALLREKERQLRDLEASGRATPEQVQRHRDVLERKRQELEGMPGDGMAAGWPRDRAQLERFLREKEAKLRELEASGEADPATLRKYRDILARKRQELERMERQGDGRPGAERMPDLPGAGPGAERMPDLPGAGPGAGGRGDGMGARKRAQMEQFLREKEAKLRELEASGQADPATLRKYREILARKRQELERMGDGRDGRPSPGGGDGRPSPGVGDGRPSPGGGDGRPSPGVGEGRPSPGGGDGRPSPGVGEGRREPRTPGTGNWQERPGTPKPGAWQQPRPHGEPTARATAPPGYESRPGVPDAGQGWTPVP